jgi:hypothetical protein
MWPHRYLSIPVCGTEHKRTNPFPPGIVPLTYLPIPVCGTEHKRTNPFPPGMWPLRYVARHFPPRACGAG